MNRISLVVVVAVALAATACVSSSESAGRSKGLANVGTYSAPPPNAPRPRVGCPQWMVEESGKGQSEPLGRQAADIMTTLATNSHRFQVIERAQLKQLLNEQGLEGIVRPEEMAQYGKVRGVDYLLFGKVTNLRVKKETGKSGFGLGDVQLPFGGRAGGMDVSSDKTTIKVEMGVDIRLVDPESGAVVAAQHSDFDRTDQANAFGVKILGAHAESDADIDISEDSKGRLMRLAIDDAFRKMLPEIDRQFASTNG